MTTPDLTLSERPADEVWRELRAQPRPIHALLRYVTSHPDPWAELARLRAALDPDAAAAILPEIEREKRWFRDRWFRGEGQ